MNDESLHRDLFLLVGYLLTSAHGLYDEPPGYGPFRLMDATGRLLGIMKSHGMADPFLAQLEGVIEAERFGSSDDQELRDTLDDLCLQFAQELKQRLKPQEEQV
jgi:hypothetical protein